MMKIFIKIVLFLVITLVMLSNYRVFTIHEGKVLLSNFDIKNTWSEIYALTEHVEKAEYYVSLYELRSREDLDFDYYIVLYTSSNLYNIKATELDVERVNRLLVNEQVEMELVEPVELWFYGLLYLMVIMFPIMRKVE